MPELPEVETVLRTLEYQLKHPQIRDVKILWPRIIDAMEPQAFQTKLIKQTIEGYERIGKYLIFVLDDYYLVSHLRMEGKFYVQNEKDAYDEKHTHLIICFTDGRELRYHDTRKFGRMYLYPKTQALSQQKAFQHCGFDVFDERITPKYLYEQFHPRKITLKQALLDQSVMAGIGNIYANEICFALHLHPETKIHRLSKKDFERLLMESRRILSAAIADGGTTIRSYMSSLGVDGRFQLLLNVHAQENKPCRNCQTLIKKKMVAGRGTYFCSHCQRKK